MRAGRAGEEGALPALRVLLVAPSMHILGGQAIQAEYLRSHLQGASGLAVTLLPINPVLPGPLRLLQRIKYVRTLVTTAAYISSLAAHLPRYDIIHVFSASYLSFVLAPTPAILLARLYGKKIVLNYHSGEAEDHLSRWPRTAVPVMKVADEIVVPSGYLVDVFQRFGLRARPVFNVVDSDMFGYRERRPLRPVCLSNRNLETLYNVSCILRAFEIIQRRYPAALLIIAGDGKQRRALEREARDLGLRNTEFVGRVTPEVMSGLYRGADIYLNSSNIDNMPGSILESFSSGLPVVTTDAGGIPYIVENEKTGLLVRRGDARGLAASAIRLLQDADLAQEIIIKARAESLRYSWSAVQDQWTSLYADLADTLRSRKSYAAAGKPLEPALPPVKSQNSIDRQAAAADKDGYLAPSIQSSSNQDERAVISG